MYGLHDFETKNRSVFNPRDFGKQIKSKLDIET